MHKPARILTIVGLSIFLLGVCLNFLKHINWLVFDPTYAFRPNTHLLNCVIFTVIIPFFLNSTQGFILGFLGYKFLKKEKQKNAYHLLIAVGILLIPIAFLAILDFANSIMVYLIISKLGLIDTYGCYTLSLSAQGAVIKLSAIILMLISTIMFLSKKEKSNEIQ